MKMKRSFVLFLSLIVFASTNSFCTANPKIQKENSIMKIYESYDELISNLVDQVISYAVNKNEVGMKFILLIDPAMINRKGQRYKDITWAAFNKVNEKAYKFALLPKDLKRILNYTWDSNNEDIYKAIEMEFKKSDFPDRIIKIEKLESPLTLVFSILKTREREAVENLDQINYFADFQIFGGCMDLENMQQKIDCFFKENNVRNEWKEMHPELKETNIPPDKKGNYFYEVAFEENLMKEINQYKFKLLVIFELNKKGTNIGSAFWLSPKYQLWRLVPYKDDYSYFYLFVCFNAPDTFQWSPGWDPDKMGEGIYYPDGNYLEEFEYKVVKKLPKEGVIIYARQY